MIWFTIISPGRAAKPNRSKKRRRHAEERRRRKFCDFRQKIGDFFMDFGEIEYQKNRDFGAPPL